MRRGLRAADALVALLTQNLTGMNRWSRCPDAATKKSVRLQVVPSRLMLIMECLN